MEGALGADLWTADAVAAVADPLELALEAAYEAARAFMRECEDWQHTRPVAFSLMRSSERAGAVAGDDLLRMRDFNVDDAHIRAMDALFALREYRASKIAQN